MFLDKCVDQYNYELNELLKKDGVFNIKYIYKLILK